MSDRKTKVWTSSEGAAKKIKQQLLAAVITLFLAAGCSSGQTTAPDPTAAENEILFMQNENIKKNADSEISGDQKNPGTSDSVVEQISSVCYDIFEKTVDSNTTDSAEVVGSIVDRLGQNGYTAVDSKNQMNMTEYERAVRFCEQAQSGEKAELTILAAAYTGGLTKYDLCSENGDLEIVKSYYQYENGCLQNKSTVNYTADFWQYTEEGYLLFTGNYFSLDYYVLALSNMPVCTALRIQPLDETCRELNRQYILPVGYSKNNLFLSDWSEEDFGDLDFYDLFDKFYLLKSGETVPYKMDENLGVGAVYRIPGEEFEKVISEYLRIAPETLRSKTKFFQEDGTYEYKPRGFYEIETSELPYPEVVSYEENDDGTIKLTVNAVYPERKTSKAFTHEVVIRPLAEGRFQYISNRVIFSEDNEGQTWHRPRLTEERWEEFYGKKEKM